MSERRQQGSTSQTYYIMIRNPATLEGKTGLAFNTALFTMAYQLDGAAPVAITLVTQTPTAAWTTGGFAEMDATKTPGLYRVDGPNLMQGAVKKVRLFWTDTTGSRLTLDDGVEVELTPYDPYLADVNTKSWAGTVVTLTGSLPDVNMKTITANIIAAASFAANALDAVWLTATRLLTAGTNIALAKGTGVTGFNDLSSAGVQSAADAAITANTLIGAINSKTTNLPAAPADESLVIAATNAITAAIAALNNLSAAQALTATAAALAAYNGTGVGKEATGVAIKAKTDNLPAAPAAVSDIPTAAAIADKVLGRNVKGGADGPTVESVSAAVAAGLLKFSISGTTLTLEYPDGTTILTRTLTRAQADAIASSL